MDLEKIPEKYREDIEKATYLLKNAGSKNVYLFGSMVTGKIRVNSDIDIGVMGLAPQRYFRVWSILTNALENEVDLVDFDVSHEFFTFLSSINEVKKIG